MDLHLDEEIWYLFYDFWFAKKKLIHNIVVVYAPLPETFAPEKQQAQLERMLNMQIGPIEGLASKYDYEKGRWKE